MAAVTPTLNRGGPGLKSQAFNDKCGVLKRNAFAGAFDLSGSATGAIMLVSATPITIQSAKLYFSEASSAQDGVEVSIGTLADPDAFAEVTSAVSQSVGATQDMTILDANVPADTPLYAYTGGGKVGDGNVYVYIEYTVDDER